MEAQGALGRTAACHHKLGKGNFLLNKHEGKEDVKLGCDIFEDFRKALYLLGKPVETGNDAET